MPRVGFEINPQQRRAGGGLFGTLTVGKDGQVDCGDRGVQRDSAQTQRLWVNLSKKYGWLDSEDLR